MNAFVRDGAVNRKRRVRQSLTTRCTEPERKKTYKTYAKKAISVPRDLVASTSKIHSGECSENQSTIVPTEKESRYTNIEFIRARAFLYLNYKKISSLNVNKLLKQYLKQFDENESHLKRIFDQCYDLTGSVETSKAMMKQLETCPILDLAINSSSRPSNRTILPRHVDEKTVKIVKKKKDNNIMTPQLKEIIDCKNLKLFGKDYSSKDKKILYTNKINDYNTTPKIDNYSDTSVTSDDEIYTPIRMTKAYSVNNKKKKFPKVTLVNKLNTGGIVQGQSNLRINNSQSKRVSAKRSTSSTNQMKTSAYKKFKKNPIDHDAVNYQISSTNVNNVEEIINPRLRTDVSVQNGEGFMLETVNDVGQIFVPQFKIDLVTNPESSELKKNIDVGEITVPREEIVECGPNVKDSALETNIDVEETAYPRLIIDECVQNDEVSELETDFDARENVTPVEIDECGPNIKDSALETNIDVEEIAYPRLIIDECVQNDEVSELETDFDSREKVTPVEIDECGPNIKDSALETNINVEEIAYPRLIIDECVQNDEVSELETNFDARENVTPAKINECGPNTKDSALETNIDVEEILYPRLIIDECALNEESSALEANFDVNENVSQVEQDKFVQNSHDNIKIKGRDECPKSSALNTNICAGDSIDLIVDSNTGTSDVVNSQINTSKIDIADTKKQVLDHEHLELKIRKIININDKVFENSTIKDLATYFLNNNFLSKIDALWTTTESELVGELILNLLNMFNDTKYNMAQLTGCLICIFREISQKSSILSSQMKLKLIVFLDAIKKYIKFYDIGLWRTWFLPSMFFDWCFIIACIFMNTKNEFKIDINKSVIRNAAAYFKKVKQCRYLFIQQDSKPTKSHKKTGIFELTRIDDLLEIDGVHATNDTNVTSHISVIHSNELETDDNCMDTTNQTTSEVIEEMCPVPVYPKISVRPEFSFSNSFVNKSKWFNGNISELLKIMNASMSKRSIEGSTVQNNTTVGINIESSNVNERQSANKNPTKTKKSKSQIEPPRVYFTIANNPKEFDINYGSSSISRVSSSSSIPQISNLSSVPKKSSSSSTPQFSSLSLIPRMSSSSSVPKKSSSSSVPQISILPSIPQMSSSSSVSKKSSSSSIPQITIFPSISQMSSSSSVPKKSCSSSFPQISILPSIPQMSSTSSVPKKSSSSSIPQISILPSISQTSSSSSVPKESSSSSITQMSSSSSVPKKSSSSSFPQISILPSIPQMSSSSSIPQMSSSLSVSKISRSSSIPQMSSSSSIFQISSSPVVPQLPSSSAAPKNLSASAAVSQNLSLSTVSQNYCPYYNNYSSINTGNHLPVGLQTVVPRNYSLYYNNLSSNYTQIPIGSQTRPSISNTTTQTSNAGSTNATSTQHQFYSRQQNSMRQHSIAMNSQLPKVANTCTPNMYQNLCSDPYCSKSSINHTQYPNSAPSYSQSLYNHNISSVTSHPQHSNTLTYPTNFAQSIPSDPLAKIAEQVASMNTCIQQQNYNYKNSYLIQNNLQTPDHKSQVSPDLPDARLPNMPNHQGSNNKTCMAANCTNTSSFPCNTCMAASYCSIQCQKSDWHYHQNECHLSF